MDTLLRFGSFGDTVTGTHQLILAVHSNTKEGCKPLELQVPPSGCNCKLASFPWAPFNKPKLAISYAKSDSSFSNHAVNNNGLPPLQATCPTSAQQLCMEFGIRPLYYLHRKDDNPANLAGS
jgi:hypothetical protein